MNLRFFDSASNIVPWCRNNNLSTRLPKINSNILLICPQKKSIEQIKCVREPIISVQKQRQTREKILSNIKCKSKFIVKCYAEYNINGLRQGFGLLKDIRYEKLEPGKPSLLIHSATLAKNGTDTSISTNYALKELAIIELRKRFAIVHTEKYIYIIGGYIFDHQIPERKQASRDYKYDLQMNKLIPIQALPNAIGFGLCIDEKYIYAGTDNIEIYNRIFLNIFPVGGNDIYNRPLCDCYCLKIKNSNETWIKLPSLPAPTTGPGIGAYHGVLHCIGGYDVLGNRSIVHGEYLILRYPQDKQWQYAPELNIIRVRPLVFIDPNDTIHGPNIYVAGGFNINPYTHKPYIVPDLQLFNRVTQCWQQLTTIPNLELSHELSFDDYKLHVSETIELSDQMPIMKNLYSFDLQKLSWINTANDTDDNRKINVRTSKQKSPSTSPFILSPDGNKIKENKTKQNSQINRSDSLPKTKTSTLKLPNSKIQQSNSKSGIDKPREMNQNLITQKKIPMNNIKRKDISKFHSSNPLSLKKSVTTMEQATERLKMKKS
ncbi:unnamed protein product [Rotaria sordida]|uniref:Kelch motif family protein n=1 Tax=Rotaria sordida TaxID=392033 RepID=A0A814YJN0_9BILA|nr:unnamed protein product [Rotaria sordida]